MQSNLGSYQRNCPHSHKASLILENSEISDSFLSRHFESCDTCSSKIEDLKKKRVLILKQIPYSSAPKEVRETFQEESREFSSKVKRRVLLLKRKRASEAREGIKMFLRDIKTAFMSKQFLFSVTFVGGTWAYFNIFN